MVAKISRTISSIIIIFITVYILISCAPPSGKITETVPQPAPTLGVNLGVQENEAIIQLNPDGEQSAVPTVSSLFSHPSDQSSIETSSQPKSTPDAPLPPGGGKAIMKSIQVYDEEINSNWMVINSPGMQIDMTSPDFPQRGNVSIRFAPKNIYDTLLFAVQESSEDVYERGAVLGLTFWLNSGDFKLNNGALSVTVIGSNDIPYWVENDNSVVNIYHPVFSETRLYYLGVNRDIPPNSWVKVELWLDERIYDPDYKYVTGFYIKNDASVLRDIYLDDIQLILLGTSEEAQLKTAPETSATAVNPMENRGSNSLGLE